MQAKLVIVTGARPQVSNLLKQAGIKEEFRDDLRVTSKEALKVRWPKTRAFEIFEGKEHRERDSSRYPAFTYEVGVCV